MGPSLGGMCRSEGPYDPHRELSRFRLEAEVHSGPRGIAAEFSVCAWALLQVPNPRRNPSYSSTLMLLGHRGKSSIPEHRLLPKPLIQQFVPLMESLKKRWGHAGSSGGMRLWADPAFN